MGQSTTVALDEVAHLLVSARGERAGHKCRELLNKAIRLCASWERAEDSLAITILKAQALAELAVEEAIPKVRSALWENSLHSLASAWRRDGSRLAAEAYAAIAVDCSQDMFNSFSEADRTRALRNARDYLNQALDREKDDQIAGALLSRKSSVLRHIAFFAVTDSARKGPLGESLRCANRSVAQLRTAATILELGLSEWALARCEATDEQYTQRLRNAETCLLDALLTSFEPGKLALARLYRLTFRPWDACQTFSQLLPRAENLRRLLRDAYIYGEAAVQLWYADYPKSITNHYLSDAKALLENAIAADYHNARMIMALAFVKAILEGPSEGRIALTEICTGEKEVSWKDVCRILAEKASTPNTVSAELVTEGFALGIEQSAIWTRLGTFSLKFLADEQLAEALYEVAVRLDPRDAIAHTNYARFLVAKGDDVSLRKAERELQKAQNFADRRFTWWKAILADLANKLGKQSHTKVIHTQKLKKPTRAIAALRDLDQIRDRFRTAKKMGNPQQRGYELEQLIFQVAKLTFGTAAPPYRLLRTEGAISQIDGYFEHRGEKYRVECKWESQPADHNHIIQFSDKLEVVGISGLFIAMAGFTASAVQRAKELRSTKVIILMDGNEAEAIFKGHFTFDEVLTRKRLHFDQLSDPYHRIVSAPDVA